MTIRVRHPGCPPKDLDLGPARGERHPYFAMRRELDEAIAFSAARGHLIAKPKP